MKGKANSDRALTGGDEDLLTQRESKKYELPMSDAWFERKRWLRKKALDSGLIAADSIEDKYGPPHIRIGNRIFYKRGDLRSYADRHKVGGPTVRATGSMG